MIKVNLRQLQDAVARAAFGRTMGEAHAAGICISCAQPPTFTSEGGRREYKQSGLCEQCFDQIGAEMDDRDG